MLGTAHEKPCMVDKRAQGALKDGAVCSLACSERDFGFPKAHLPRLHLG